MADISHVGISNWRVRDVMSTPIQTCPADLDLASAAELMVRERIHFILVVGPPGDDGESPMVGVLSALDLVSALDQGASTRPVGEVIGPLPQSVPADAPLRVAVHEMREERAHHLLVVAANSGRPVGVVSTLDIAQVLGVAPAE